jgi:hypothetical protein
LIIAIPPFRSDGRNTKSAALKLAMLIMSSAQFRMLRWDQPGVLHQLASTYCLTIDQSNIPNICKASGTAIDVIAFGARPIYKMLVSLALSSG